MDPKTRAQFNAAWARVLTALDKAKEQVHPGSPLELTLAVITDEVNLMHSLARKATE